MKSQMHSGRGGIKVFGLKTRLASDDFVLPGDSKLFCRFLIIKENKIFTSSFIYLNL